MYVLIVKILTISEKNLAWNDAVEIKIHGPSLSQKNPDEIIIKELTKYSFECTFVPSMSGKVC